MDGKEVPLQKQSVLQSSRLKIQKGYLAIKTNRSIFLQFLLNRVLKILHIRERLDAK
jgi:hypothetical protein